MKIKGMIRRGGGFRARESLWSRELIAYQDCRRRGRVHYIRSRNLIEYEGSRRWRLPEEATEAMKVGRKKKQTWKLFMFKP